MLQERLNADDPNVPVVFLESFRHAHGRPRRSEGHDHHRDITVGLPPNFLAGPGIMGGHIVWIVELICTEILIRMLAQHSVNDLYCPVRAQACRCETQFRPEGFEDFLSFLADPLGHGQAQSVPLGRSNHGEANAGIAAGGFQNDLVFRQFPPPLGPFDHLKSDPVLDGAPRIETLQFDENPDIFIGI